MTDIKQVYRLMNLFALIGMYIPTAYYASLLINNGYIHIPLITITFITVFTAFALNFTLTEFTTTERTIKENRQRSKELIGIKK